MVLSAGVYVLKFVLTSKLLWTPYEFVEKASRRLLETFGHSDFIDEAVR